MSALMVPVPQRGFGLVELLVGIVISLIVLVGTIFVFVGNSESSLLHMRTTSVIQNVRSAMDRMGLDLMRSGYVGYRFLASRDVAPEENPFGRYDGAVLTTVVGHDCDAAGVCRAVTYAYNIDDDGAATGSIPAVGTSGLGCSFAAGVSADGNNLEMFGLRFVERDIDGDGLDEGWIEMRTSAADDCSPTTIAAGAWTPITDQRRVRIGDLNDGATADDRVGFVVSDECVGFIDNVGAAGDEPDGDIFAEAVEPADELTCDDLREGSNPPDPRVAAPFDYEVRTRRVVIQMRGWSRQDPSVTFRLTQVVDLPNHVAVPVVPL